MVPKKRENLMQEHNESDLDGVGISGSRAIMIYLLFLTVLNLYFAGFKI
jgi:hypothetical protein